MPTSHIRPLSIFLGLCTFALWSSRVACGTRPWGVLDFLDALPGCLQFLVLRNNYLSVTTSQVPGTPARAQALARGLVVQRLGHRSANGSPDTQPVPRVEARRRVLWQSPVPWCFSWLHYPCGV